MPLDGGAKFFQGEFGVITGARRFGNRRFAFRKQSGQQHCRLHLRAGHGHFVVHAAQPAPANFEWREIVLARGNLSAHFAQRRKDALHRALVERVVAGNFRREVLAGQNAGKQTNGGAGVSSVERTPAALQSVQSTPSHADKRVFDFHVGAE
jgi:hypothetical protein